MVWPGAASVVVSIVHAARGNPVGYANVVLDGQSVTVINSRLLPKPERPDPCVLLSNGGMCYMGVTVLGDGFRLSEEERENAIGSDPSAEPRIWMYVGGEHLNTAPNQESQEWVINLTGYDEVQARKYAGLFRRLSTTVKIQRSGTQYDNIPFWEYQRARGELYAAISELSRCIVTAQTAKYPLFSFQPPGRVFTAKVFVFPIECHSGLAVLQSRVHRPWAWLMGSTMKEDLSYTALTCFQTFPFPKPDPRTVIPELEAAGQAFYEARARFMVETDQGLTKTYNALKDPNNHESEVAELRRLTEAMDRAVLDAYGWTDLEVPPYCPTTPAERAAHKAFEDEVIDRLYVLNAERAREEERLGLGKKKKPAKKSAGKKAKSDDDGGQTSLL